MGDELRFVGREMETLAETTVLKEEVHVLFVDVSELELALRDDGHVDVRGGGSTVFILLVGEEVSA